MTGGYFDMLCASVAAFAGCVSAICHRIVIRNLLLPGRSPCRQVAAQLID
jgi:hypothetical protein